MDSGKIDSGADKDEIANEQSADAQENAGVKVLPTWKNRVLTKDYISEAQKNAGFDIPFLLLTLLILMVGVIMVLSASFARSYYTSGQPMMLFTRQLVFALSGVAIMLVVSRIQIKTISRFSVHSLLISIIMLVLVLNIGVKVNGARRWIGVGTGNNSFTFQPSEIAKLSLVLCFAQMSCKFGKRMKTFKFGVIPFVALTAVVVALLWLEPHLSAIVIVSALSVIMMFAGGTRLRWFAIAGLAIASVAVIVFLPAIRNQISGDTEESVTFKQIVQESVDNLGYAGNRINAWLDPDADPLGDGLQIRQSLFAIGSGGAFGQGLGQSRQKYLYLPEEHNDYIFAIVCEELGYIGDLVILTLFALLIIRGFWIALHARDKYSSLITIGITSLLAIQVFLNVAVVTNLVPATGISLPFFSYGGTALWIQLLQMGLILAVSREIPEPGDDRVGVKS